MSLVSEPSDLIMLVAMVKDDRDMGSGPAVPES